MLYNLLRMLLVALVFFDFLLFNVEVSVVNVTALRVVIITLICYLLLYVLKNGIKKPSILFEKLCYVFFGFWLVWSVLQLPFATDKVEVIKSLYYLAIFLAIIFFVNFNLTKRKLKQLLGLLTYIYISLIGIGYFELLFDKHFYISKIFVEQLDIKAATGVFYNQNDFCLYLVMFLPFTLFYTKNKAIQMLLIMSTLGLIVVNESFLALAAIAIQIILLMINVKMDYRLKVIYILSLFVAVMALLPKFLNIYNQFIEQLQVQSGSAHVRLMLMQNTLDIIFNKTLLMGVGLNNISNALQQYSNTSLIDPHNWWLELLATSGIFVFIAYIILFGYIFLIMYKRRSQSIMFYSFLAMIGFIIASVSPSSVFNLTFVWLFYGILIAIIRMYKYEQCALK